MQPLEITDQYGDIISIAKKYTDCIYIHILEQDTNTDISVEINKDQAIQIINHLKKCFEL